MPSPSFPTSCPTCSADFTKPRALAVFSTATIRQFARIHESGVIDDYSTGDEVEFGSTQSINCARCDLDICAACDLDPALLG